MNRGLRAIVLFLLNKKYIGNRHFPERKLVSSRTKYLSMPEQEEFEQEYKSFVNNMYLLKMKERTGKGTEWDISLNPRRLKEIYETLETE